MHPYSTTRRRAAFPGRIVLLVAAHLAVGTLSCGTSMQGLEQACAKGDVQECASVGSMYLFGDNVPKDLPRAIPLLKQACRGGNAKACHDVGALYLNGEGGVRKDIVQALQFLNQACHARLAESCHSLGLIYWIGASVKVDRERAEEYFKLGCDDGNLESCTSRIRVHDPEYASPSDTPESHKNACDRGNAEECTVVGLMYQEGRGVGKDWLQAVRLYRKACDGGDDNGCERLSLMYIKANDIANAALLLKQPCAKGRSPSCTAYALLVLSSGGADENAAQTVQVVKQSCERQDPRACTAYGMMLMKGYGTVTKDIGRAVQFLGQGCDGAIAFGCTQLGILYEVKDPARAAEFFKKGCDGGDKAACLKLERPGQR